MSKIRVKGSVISQTITTTLTAVAQIIDFSHTGVETETYDATTLDTTGAGREMAATGLVTGGTLDFSMFLDVALAGHQTIMDDITTPVERNWSLTFADAATTVATFDVAGIGFGITGSMDDGLKADVSLTLDQLMNYPT
jgi:hypothetical protein